MNRQQYADFHRYLAILFYEYNKMYFTSPNLTEEAKNNIKEILESLEKIMTLCLIEGE